MHTILLLFISCTLILSEGQTKQELCFEDVKCNVQTPGINTNSGKVFKPCRQYIYRAIYRDNCQEKISEELIWMMATGRQWEYQPELQKELIIQYAYEEALIDKIWEYNINDQFPKNDWIKKEVTGIIENEYQVWMHPFRSNQYFFTQVASFPMVKLPLEVGKTWTANLNIYDGWGNWSNTVLENKYEVLGFESVDTPYRQLDAWHALGTTYAEFGITTHDFWYHEEYGFIKMVIKNYEGQLLTIELESLKE